MFDIICLGNYSAEIKPELVETPVEKVSLLEDLRPLINALCRERFRRIDRFIQLSLLGSARCVGAGPLEANTGLYIASSEGPMANNIAVQQQIFLHGELPKPANFINTLGNSAGYYVARNFQLQGQNLFLSRRNAPMEAAFQLAALDLQTGMVEQALIGVVDQCVEPLADHRRRMGLAIDAPIAEGSHWFLVRRVQRGEERAPEKPLARVVDVKTLADRAALRAWLKARRVDVSHVYLAPVSPAPASLGPSFPKEQGFEGLVLDDMRVYEPVMGFYSSRTAGALLKFIDTKAGGGLLTIKGDEEGRYHLTCTVLADKSIS